MRVRFRKPLVLVLSLTCGLIVAGLLLARATTALQSQPTLVQKQEDKVERIGGQNVVLQPPIGTPTISASAAWEAVQKEFPDRTGKPDQITAILANMTTPGMNRTMSDGSLSLKYKDLLTWVIEVPNVESVSFGGPAPGDNIPPNDSGSSLCPAFFTVDATTGTALFRTQDC
jgi:hypothetical protein